MNISLIKSVSINHLDYLIDQLYLRAELFNLSGKRVTYIYLKILEKEVECSFLKLRMSPAQGVLLIVNLVSGKSHLIRVKDQKARFQYH